MLFDDSGNRNGLVPFRGDRPQLPLPGDREDRLAQSRRRHPRGSPVRLVVAGRLSAATAGEPWQTQALVKRITGQLYSLTPGGEPGNDDLGALSSWYVWAALGLYPQTPGVPMLVLGTPQFPGELIHGAYGQLTIVASGAGDRYVRGLTVNGRPSQRTYIAVNGTRELDFTLSKTPDTSWGAAAGDAPPSFGLCLPLQPSSCFGRIGKISRRR